MQHTVLAFLKTSVTTFNCAGKQHTLLALLKTSKITIELKILFAEGFNVKLHGKATNSPGSYLRDSTDGMQQNLLAFLKTSVITFNCAGKQHTLSTFEKIKNYNKAHDSICWKFQSLTAQESNKLSRQLFE